MTAVPRPTTKLTAEQQTLLAAAVELVKKARDADEVGWNAALAARRAGVPDEILCGQTGLSRATLNRRFGPRESK